MRPHETARLILLLEKKISSAVLGLQESGKAKSLLQKKILHVEKQKSDYLDGVRVAQLAGESVSKSDLFQHRRRQAVLLSEASKLQLEVESLLANLQAVEQEMADWQKKISLQSQRKRKFGYFFDEAKQRVRTSKEAALEHDVQEGLAWRSQVFL